jgi:hypothetical protein
MNRTLPARQPVTITPFTVPITAGLFAAWARSGNARKRAERGFGAAEQIAFDTAVAVTAMPVLKMAMMLSTVGMMLQAVAVIDCTEAMKLGLIVVTPFVVAQAASALASVEASKILRIIVLLYEQV